MTQKDTGSIVAQDFGMHLSSYLTSDICVICGNECLRVVVGDKPLDICMDCLIAAISSAEFTAIIEKMKAEVTK